MKKTHMLRRLISVLLITIMAYSMTAFAVAVPYESGHAEYEADGKKFNVYSILYEDSTNRYRASAWAETKDSSYVPARYIGVDAWLCTPKNQVIDSSGYKYNTSANYFQYAITPSNYEYKMVYASGEVDLYTGTEHIYKPVPASPYVGGNYKSIDFIKAGLTAKGTFPVNECGETYGNVKAADIVGARPDLIAAVGNGGIEGYLRMSDMRPNITCDADIEAYYEKLRTDPDIPLYDVHGNVIGSFTISGSEDIASEGATVEQVKSAIAADMDSPTKETIEEVKARLDKQSAAAKNSSTSTVVQSGGFLKDLNMEEGLINQTFPVAKNGMTYGTMAQSWITGEYPDLVSVVATNDKSGWVKLEEFEPIRYLVKKGASTEELNAYIDSVLYMNETRLIPVYDLDMNVIGEFSCGYSER